MNKLIQIGNDVWPYHEFKGIIGTHKDELFVGMMQIGQDSFDLVFGRDEDYEDFIRLFADAINSFEGLVVSVYDLLDACGGELEE